MFIVLMIEALLENTQQAIILQNIAEPFYISHFVYALHQHSLLRVFGPPK